MITIKCNLSNKMYNIKKICSPDKMPKTAVYYTTVYFESNPDFPYSGVQDIYINSSGYYAGIVRQLKKQA